MASRKNTYRNRPSEDSLNTLRTKVRTYYNTIHKYPTRGFLRIGYLFLLGLSYIWNTHYYEKTVHKIKLIEPKVNSLRVRYTELQSSYIFHSTQSEVAKSVASLGLSENRTPPYKIKHRFVYKNKDND